MNDDNKPPFIPSVKEWNEMRSLIIETHKNVLKILREKEKELLTPDEVCQMLRISRSTYQRHVKAGLFEQIKQGDKANSSAFVKRSQIEELIERGKI